MTLKAFYCFSEWNEAADIIFAENRNKARWQFIRRWCDGELSDLSIRRAKRYDQYGATDSIPASHLIEDGWYFYCQNCDSLLSEDSLEEKKMPISDVVGTLRGVVYCCTRCEEEHEERKRRDEIIRGEVLQTMLWRLEDIFGRDNLTYGDFRLVITHAGTITSMELPMVVDGIAIRYYNTVSEDKTLEEWKKMKHTLTFPKSHEDYMCQKYGLCRLEK